jgi:hypothetical protein
MRTAALLLIAPLAACSFGVDARESGGIQPSGSGTSRIYAVSGFDKIGLAGADDAVVTVGPAFSVRAEGPSEELDRLRIDKNGDTLEIGRKRNSFGWSASRGKVTVHVTLPALSGASLSGSGDMRVDRVSGGSFAGEAAGSGHLTLDRMAVDAASFSIAGSGTVTGAGTARSLQIDIAGSGELQAAGLTAARAKVNIAGSGSARASVVGDAEVSLLGSGDADLGPKARCHVSKLGSGEAHCGA